MDPVSAIAASMALGAIVGKTTASLAVKDAYDQLKNLIISRYSKTSIEAIEQAPASKALRAVVEEDLNAANAGRDAELIGAARRLIELVQEQAPAALQAIDIGLQEFSAANLRLLDVIGSSTGPMIGEATASRDFYLRNARVGLTSVAHKNDDRTPVEWAMTQNNLGVALLTLGERENGTEHVQEAVQAYRSALEEWTRDRTPVEWAMTQNNLGVALLTLGERENGTEHVQEAVQAYRSALEEWTRDRTPVEWAMTQNNLGVALLTLGERENGTEHVQEAVQAYRSALEEWTRDRTPVEWAMTQNNLGVALLTLGERENGTEHVQEAVQAYRSALEEWTRDRTPVEWAMTQNNLGVALLTLGERENGTEHVQEALEAFELCLKIVQDVWPSTWVANLRIRHDQVSSAPFRPLTRDDALNTALKAARTRGQSKAAGILKGEEMLTTRDFSTLIGASNETVDAKRKKGEVLGLESATSGIKYPRWQVTDTGSPLPGLSDLFAALGKQPWTVYRFLRTAHAELGGQTALDALKAGQIDAVLGAARNQTTGVFR